MNKDNVYIYDKRLFTRSLLGEIQSNFNMSFVIDGTKDSCSLVVRSYEESQIEPYTILWHEKTNTWWVVSHDKVERYQNDSDFVYVHNLELLGAIELFNARDLTDCAFNDNTYTIGDFLLRLFGLSNWEYNIQISSDMITKNVDFIKTFENYTLLSALREFLDAYNCSAKLTFVTQQGTHKITSGRVTIIPKTGDPTLPTHNINEFDDVRQTKTMSKESFGTCVVSNAENVISSIPKTYPAVGGVGVSSNEYRIKAKNAIIRLPSKVFKANWLAMVYSKPTLDIQIDATISEQTYTLHLINGTDFYINPLDDNSFVKSFDKIISMTRAAFPSSFAEQFINYFQTNEKLIIDTIKKACTIRLYNGNELNPVSGTIIKGEKVPYLVEAKYKSKTNEPTRPLIFCDKEMRDTLPYTYTGIYWERGSDEIKGFDAFVPDTGKTARIDIEGAENTELQDSGNEKNIFTYNDTYGSATMDIKIEYSFYFQGSGAGPNNIQWIVNYIPMSDIKLKVDNTRDKNDIQLYNQTGKVTDNFALSKLINSYAKEISSDTITKFMHYTNFDDVPKIGSLVYNGNDVYVINNISLTFTQNENTDALFGYFIEGEFTMSKYVATKSLMVNPNTNIRDYGIPQNYNVKRKQVYRDYYELNYAADSSADYDYFMDPSNIFTINHYPTESTELVAIMKLDYDIEVNNQTTWYYQLETTRYVFDKMLYVILDFKDNNIIGYCNQNMWSGFVISRILTGAIDDINTPISYTDKNGNVADFDILLLDNEQMTKVYDDYGMDNDDNDQYTDFIYSGYTLYNSSIFIDKDIYDLAYDDGYKIRISELGYNKDALEVPVFEYGCQIADSEEVLIGDNIMKQYGDEYIYLYSYASGTNLRQETAVPANHVEYLQSTNELKIQYSAEIQYSSASKELDIDLYRATRYLKDYGSFIDDLRLSFGAGLDYAIFRHAYNPSTNEEIVDLMFIIKKVPANTQTQVLKINHYKLK